MIRPFRWELAHPARDFNNRARQLWPRHSHGHNVVTDAALKEDRRR
jgi:hypothetical protein